MRRREFIGGLGSAAIAWPLVAAAQQLRKIPRIGVLWHGGSPEEEAIYLGALRQGFSNLGYVEGKTLALENRFAAEQHERFNSFATELVELKVDVLVAVTGPGALAAQRATTTIPVVFILVPDPVKSRIVESIARPGGNITRLSQVGLDLMAKRLELLKETVVGLSRMTVLLNPSNPDYARRYLEETLAAADPLKVTVRSVEARTPDDLEHAFSVIAQDRSGGVTVMNDPMFWNERRRIAELAMTRGLPVVAFSREMAEAGALLTYGADHPALFRRAASYVDKILKGAKPADLPVELPTKFELVINLKTPKALGLSIPPSIMVRADEVIE
jgi:putative ABC transport system substrate-binding protein